MHNPVRILVADDFPDNVTIVKAMLESQGYEVVTAVDGEQALALARSTVPDLILLDIMMPKVDGLAVCRQLKADASLPFIPIVILTAKSEPADVASGLDAGGDEFLSKPVDEIALLARVRSMLRIKALHEELAERNRQLESISRQDGLTGLANRRCFDETLRRAFMRSARQRTWLTLILCDVDFFKLFNDRYGHVEGDECLRKIAATLVGGCRRPDDLAARYGGEEFALILPDTSLEAGVRIAEALCAEVVKLAIPHADSTAHTKVSMSVGIAACIAQAGTATQSLVECADRLLYKAKQQGRNRCVASVEAAMP